MAISKSAQTVNKFLADCKDKGWRVVLDRDLVIISTDGGGMGAISAVKRGVFKMTKSGVHKRILTALSKAL